VTRVTISGVNQSERILRARLAAYVLHSKVDSRAHTAPAREAFNARFEREVDPDGVLAPKERARRAALARKAYYTRLSLKAAQARRAAREAPGR
jgi:hypothetical protein